jgi:chemotaxis signal transduction protein
MPVERLLRFPLGREHYGLRLADAAQVTEVEAAAPVPRVLEEIAGLADVRGRIVTLVDLARLVGHPESTPRTGGWALVLAPPRDHLALLVGAEVDILGTDLELARELEDDAGRPQHRLTRGVLTREGALLHLIHPESVASLCDRRMRDYVRRAGGGPSVEVCDG